MTSCVFRMYIVFILLLGAFHVHGSSLVTSLNEINDEYCDRVDGSDETETSACSYLHVRYKCSDGKEIPTSRVNDGVCDCCDGGDEYAVPFPITCTVTCRGSEVQRSLAHPFGGRPEIHYPLPKRKTKQKSATQPNVDNETIETETAIDRILADQPITNSLDSTIAQPARYTIKMGKTNLSRKNKTESMSSKSRTGYFYYGSFILIVFICMILRCLYNRNYTSTLVSYNDNRGDPIYLHNYSDRTWYFSRLQTTCYFVSGIIRTICLRLAQCCSSKDLFCNTNTFWGRKANAHTV